MAKDKGTFTSIVRKMVAKAEPYIPPIPNSTNVPCCDAKITLANARKSNSGVVAPKSGV